MGIFLRQSHNVKPPRWGSFADVQYAIRVNSEKIYDCDPDDDVLVMPLFWGLPCLDYSGYNNHGTNHGATYKDGSLDFDGDDYVDAGGDASLEIADALSIGVWVKTNDRVNPRWILGKNRDTTGGYHVYFHQDKLLAKINGASGNSITEYENPIVGSLIHVVFTYHKDNGGILYYNGDSVDTSAASGAIVTGAVTNLNIGRLCFNELYEFNGSIDKVRITKTVHTADQTALFNDNKYGLYQKVSRPIWSIPAAPPVGAIMNQFQGANLGADLFNGTLL